MREEIKVGQVTIFAETVETPVIFDECYLCYKDRFTLIDVNDIYLVIHETPSALEMPTREYKAFTSIVNAYSYLELYGIEKDA